MNGTATAPIEAPEKTQARIFAEAWSKDSANGMLSTLKRVAKRAGFITRIALGVSMPHQIGYILALAMPHMHWDSPSDIAESVTMVALAFGVPVCTDLLILNCIETIGATAASKWSRIGAFLLMLIPVSASGYVNFAAPGPDLIKVLAAFIVTMVPMGESLRFIRPDFAKMERYELEVVEQVAKLPDPPEVPKPPTKKIEGVLQILREAPHLTAVQAKALYEQRYGEISYNYVADTVSKVRNGQLAVA